ALASYVECACSWATTITGNGRLRAWPRQSCRSLRTAGSRCTRRCCRVEVGTSLSGKSSGSRTEQEILDMSTLQFSGMVVHKGNGRPVVGVVVEVWDHGRGALGALAVATTGARGEFTLELDQALIDRVFGRGAPTLHFE